VSVHVIERAASVPAHEVRWRDRSGVNRSLRFNSAIEARQFDAVIRAKVALERATVAWRAIPAAQRAAAEGGIARDAVGSR
jgi:hypothetical protein